MLGLKGKAGRHLHGLGVTDGLQNRWSCRVMLIFEFMIFHIGTSCF